MNNQLSFISCLSWFNNIRAYLCPSVVPNSFSVSFVCSVVKTGGAQ